MQKYSSTARKKLTSTELREFRSKISTLKKQGLIKPSLDARSARPFFISRGKTLAEIVNKESSRLSKLTESVPAATKAQKDLGDLNLLPLNRAVSVRDFPVPAKTLPKFLNEISTRSPELGKLKRKGERFAFSIDGNRSYQLYDDLDDLAEALEKYESFMTATPSDNRKLYDVLKIVRWNKTRKEWKPAKQKLSKTKLAEKRKQDRRTKKKKK